MIRCVGELFAGRLLEPHLLTLGHLETMPIGAWELSQNPVPEQGLMHGLPLQIATQDLPGCASRNVNN